MAAIHGKNYGEPTLDLNFAGNKSLIDTTTEKNYVTFSRAQSGNEATYIGSDGLIKYAAADEARFDHDPATLESLGLLIEESRTNVTRPSDFSSIWNYTTPGDGIKQTAYGLAPDGSTSSIYLQPNSTARVFRNTSGSGITAGTYTVSLFYKGDKPISVAGPGANEGLTDVANYGNGWKRAASTLTFTGGGYLDITVLSGTSVELWGIQAELGSFQTSYIPTTSSAVSRAADAASISGTNFTSWFNQSEGTFVGTVGSRGMLLLSSVSTGPNVYQDTTYGFSSNSEDYGGSFNLRYEDRSQVILNYMNAGWTSSIPMQNYAGAYSAEGVAGAWEGNLGTPQTTLSKPLQDDLSHMWIGRSHAFPDSKVQHISRLTYYPKRLPDIELQQLTK